MQYLFCIFLLTFAHWISFSLLPVFCVRVRVFPFILFSEYKMHKKCWHFKPCWNERAHVSISLNSSALYTFLHDAKSISYSMKGVHCLSFGVLCILLLQLKLQLSEPISVSLFRLCLCVSVRVFVLRDFVKKFSMKLKHPHTTFIKCLKNTPILHRLFLYFQISFGIFRMLA